MFNKPALGLFVAIISVSFAAVIIVSISEEVHPLSIAFFRLLFTTLIVLPLVLLHKKTRKEILKIPRKTLLIMTSIGIILSAHFALWITSLDYTSVASSVLLVTAHPVLVGPIAHYFLKEKLSNINIVGIVLSIFGVAILVYGNYGLGDLTMDTLEGNILAILGGIAAGLYILGGRQIRKTVSVVSYAFIVYSIATVSLFIICLISNAPVYDLNIEDYYLIFIMALVSGIFGHTVYNWSLKHVRASLASVALLCEPLGSTILALIIPWINQIPSKYTIIGGVIILLGIYLTAKTTIRVEELKAI